MSYNVVHHIKPANADDYLFPQSLVILSGDASIAEYCEWTANAMLSRAHIIAVAGPGVNVKLNPDAATVIYSQDADYRVGEPISAGDKRYEERCLQYINAPTET